MVDGLKRVVVTGMGITSCLGNDLDTVAKNLQAAKCVLPTPRTLAPVSLRICRAPLPLFLSHSLSWWVSRSLVLARARTVFTTNVSVSVGICHL